MPLHIFHRHGVQVSSWLLSALAFNLFLTLTVTSSIAAMNGGYGIEANPKENLRVARLKPRSMPGGQEGHEQTGASGGKGLGSQRFVSAERAVVKKPTGSTSPDLKHNVRSGGSVVLNFSNANLWDLLRTIADITGENFITAPGLTAKVSVQTSRPVARKDIFGIFESILKLNGLAAVKTGKYYNIIKAPDARHHAMDLFYKADGVPDGDRMINMVVPLEFASSEDIIKVLKPTVSVVGNVISYREANTIIITDTASNVKGLLDMIGLLDVDAFRRLNMDIVKIQNMDVGTLESELSEVFAAIGYGEKDTQLVVVPIERLNSLILFASSEALLSSAKEWIDRLDRTSSVDTASIHIYYVKNDEASVIGDLLMQLYAGKDLVVSSAGAEPTQSSKVAGASGGTKPSITKILSAPEADDGKKSGSTGEGVKIFVHKPSNALIIQSSSRDYRKMLDTIKELDRPPKQVLIDALIVEVKLDESLKYGVQWSLLSGNVNVQQNTGIFPSTVDNLLGKITTPIGVASPAGFAVVATDASKFFGAIQALSMAGKVNVLSNPHILVRNYEKASINVGSDEPIATQSTQTVVTGTSGIIQSIEYRKTGITLTVTPQITEGGIVAMTIRQEVSDKSTDRTVGTALFPSFTNRETETTVVAKDGQSLVIGGLIQDKVMKTVSGVPILSKIPLLGALFRFTSSTVGKTELLILITPRVISDFDQAATVTSDIKGKLEKIKDLLRKNGYVEGGV